jgi:hypothetical protein
MQKYILNKLLELSDCFSLDDKKIPMTDIFNEGWMLRVCLDWYSQQENTSEQKLFTFTPTSIWASEAMLSSPFKRRIKSGDKLAEGTTNADGVLGDLVLSKNSKWDLSLQNKPEIFYILEAKMNSKLASGVSNVDNYNQSTRNIACMIRLLINENISLDSNIDLGFYVLAPNSKSSIFEEPLSLNFIKKELENRLFKYEEFANLSSILWKENDYNEFLSFKNTYKMWIEKIDVKFISWETIIDDIKLSDTLYAVQLENYYKRCLEENKVKSKL